jgi:hypothetical protein
MGVFHSMNGNRFEILIEDSIKIHMLVKKVNSYPINDSFAIDDTIGVVYRPSPNEDFPISNYILHKTGHAVNNVFDMQNSPNVLEYRYVIDYLNVNGYVCIYDYIRYTIKGHVANYKKMLFEKQTDDGLILCEINGIPYDSKLDTDDSEVLCTIYSYNSREEFDALTTLVKKNIKEYNPKHNNIHLVISTSRGYNTTSFELPKMNIDIKLNYGSGFEKVHDKIIKDLNKKNGKGLVLLHGTPGTGKTHYLKYLASKIKSKNVLFIPPYLADFIVSPELTPFLIENSDSVLFIEDAERVISDRNVNSSTGVSNILNLTDGILSDILNIQIVATFNMDKQKIDPALLRKGRLIAEHKFEALSIEESQIMLDKLNIKHMASRPMTLSEIYNFNEVEFKSESPRQIGFGK